MSVTNLNETLKNPIGGMFGGDHAMLREVLNRRLCRTEPRRPDLVLINGDRGQPRAAPPVLVEHGPSDGAVGVVAIAKRRDHHAGRETLHMTTHGHSTIALDDPVLYFPHSVSAGLCETRPTALPSAAITFVTHGPCVIQIQTKSQVLGACRKKALLYRFGSAQVMAKSDLTELENVTGLSRMLAKKIYDHFHASG